jgi:hypothetical protein
MFGRHSHGSIDALFTLLGLSSSSRRKVLRVRLHSSWTSLGSASLMSPASRVWSTSIESSILLRLQKRKIGGAIPPRAPVRHPKTATTWLSGKGLLSATTTLGGRTAVFIQLIDRMCPRPASSCKLLNLPTIPYHIPPAPKRTPALEIIPIILHCSLVKLSP